MKPNEVPHRMLYCFWDHPEAVECCATIHIRHNMITRFGGNETYDQAKRRMVETLHKKMAETLDCPLERIAYEPLP